MLLAMASRDAAASGWSWRFAQLGRLT